MYHYNNECRNLLISVLYLLKISFTCHFIIFITIQLTRSWLICYTFQNEQKYLINTTVLENMLYKILALLGRFFWC